MGSGAYDPNGVIQKAVRTVKEATDLVVITDLCLCEYTSHGHCGLIRGEAVLNDETLPILGEVAISHAEAGADVIAPSGMMDGMVGAIRQELDVFAREKVRGAAEIAAVRTAEACEYFSRAGDLPAEHLQPAHDERMLVRHRNFRLAQQPAHEPPAGVILADIVDNLFLQELAPLI